MTRTGLARLAPGVAVLLLAAALRAPLLTASRFHPDEALYAGFARQIAAGRDPLLSRQLVDKPPLSLYLMAASFTAFGASEFAARLPSLAASLLSIALLVPL
ncbi:MAG: phospholipid carrier-dependent glycosyltransferase, partial [Chloroflexi bacterium]|nr:phospholipid carrier-dependent glycosyltransferase [Chloroflexota bacterium]